MASVFELGAAWGAGGEDFYSPDNTNVFHSGATLASVGGRACIGFTAGANPLHGTSNTPHTLGASEFRFFSFGIRLTGTLTNLPDGAGTDSARIIQIQDSASVGIALGIVAIDASTFYLWYGASTNPLGGGAASTGTTVLSVDTWYDIRVALDNAGNTINVWIDDTHEFTDQARTVTSEVPYCTLYAATGTGITNYFSSLVVAYGTALSDWPARNPEGHYLGGNGDNATATYSNQATAGSCSDGTGTYTLWDDWNSGEQDGATSLNACCGNATGKEISDLTTAALTGSNVRGVMMSTYSRAREASKTVSVWHILKDTVATTESELQITNIGASSYTSRRTSWVSPPAGSWSDYISSATFNHASAAKLLAAGVRNVNTNGTADMHTAMGLEIFLYEDVEPTAASALRTSPAFTPGPLIF